MRNLLICLCLAIATAAVYFPVRNLHFVNYDDPQYVYQNARIKKGLSPQNIVWAFESLQLANYHPLTWLSYELDASLFDLNPRAMHIENVAIHIANTLLVFLVLRCATGNILLATVAGGIFGLHPLHVESVAWISERKDLLCGLFYILGLGAYVAYTRTPSRPTRCPKYMLVLLLLTLALLSKPMAVTFPFVLLLWDFWPLHRSPALSWKWLVVEKLPLVLLCAAGCGSTILAQNNSGAIMGLVRLPISQRMINIPISYARYLGKFIWPLPLTVIYPLRPSWPMWQLLASLALLIAITGWCAHQSKRRPQLIVGWLMFLGMLVPTIGVLQVGAQSIADRYMYLPLIGLAIIVASLVEEIARTAIKIAIGLVVAIAMGAVTVHQLEYWENTRTLFEHALAVTRDNLIAHVQLGYMEATLGNIPSAKAHYEEAIRIDPAYYVPQFNLGNLLLYTDPPAAIDRYQQAEILGGKRAEIENNLGIALVMTGKLPQAAQHFQTAIQLRADYPDPHSNLGDLLMRVGDYDRAQHELNQALQIDPDFPQAKRDLARLSELRAAQLVTPSPAR